MSPENKQQKNILLIDDDIDLQQLTRIALRSKGYIVEVANNGLEGLEKLKTLTPHLIILDMNMPKMGGLEFYQRICEGSSHPKYPVLVLTARANMEQLFKELNIDGFMAKPFEIDELINEAGIIIKKYLNFEEKYIAAQEPHNVCIADNTKELLSQIGGAFLNAGYIVNPARTGVEAIERICADVPDAALINLNLVDIPGDIVILKLKRIAKIKGVKFILYTPTTAEEISIAEKIRKKEGFDQVIVYSDAQDLINAVKTLLKN